MVWVELTQFDNIILETGRGKMRVYRNFAEKLAVKLGLMEEEWFPVFISTPTKVNVPKELLEFLKIPEKVIEIARKMGYRTEVGEWKDEHKRWRNYWVFAPKYSGRIGEYVFTEIIKEGGGK